MRVLQLAALRLAGISYACIALVNWIEEGKADVGCCVRSVVAECTSSRLVEEESERPLPVDIGATG